MGEREIMKTRILKVKFMKSLTLTELAAKVKPLTLEFTANKNKSTGSIYSAQMSLHWSNQLDCLELICKTISTDPEFLTACGFLMPEIKHQNPAHYSNLYISKGK